MADLKVISIFLAISPIAVFSNIDVKTVKEVFLLCSELSRERDDPDLMT